MKDMPLTLTISERDYVHRMGRIIDEVRYNMSTSSVPWEVKVTFLFEVCADSYR